MKNSDGDYKTTAYAAKVKDPERLKVSSSGGMFTAFSNFIIEDSGAVACTIYDYKTDELNFSLIFSSNERDKALGSKYIQSNAGNIFNDAVVWMNEHPQKKLLFIGTGCQAAAFEHFISEQNLRNNTYIVDIICHGVPSPKLWHDYCNEIEKKKKGSITYITFKDKRWRWESPMALATIRGKEYSMADYMKLYNEYSGFMYRPACYSCPYATTERRSDITIGDFWGIDQCLPDFYDKYGNSLVLIHSEKGKQLFGGVGESIECIRCRIEDCLQPNLIAPTEKSDHRNQFWNEYEQYGLKFLLKKYGQLSGIEKMKNMAKKWGIRMI